MKISEFKLDDVAGKSLMDALLKDYWATTARVMEIALPQFIIGDVGITHRWITHWDNQGLIDNKREGTEWRKFSFLEYMWLRIIVKLRAFNFPLPAIKQVKKFLWQSLSTEEFSSLLDDLSENIKTGLVPKFPNDNYENLVEISKKNWKRIKPQMKFFNRLFFMIFDMLFYKKPYCLLISEEGKCGLIFLGDNGTTEQGLEIIKESVHREDFTVINLYRILQEFFSNEKVDDSTIEKIAVLTDQEKQIIELIRKNDYKELSIKQKNGKEYLVGVKRNKSVDTITNEVSSIINRNKYQDIKLTTGEGKIIFAEVTDKLKI